MVGFAVKLVNWIKSECGNECVCNVYFAKFLTKKKKKKSRKTLSLGAGVGPDETRVIICHKQQ